MLVVALGERAAPQPQLALQAHAHVAAHDRRHRGDEHLVATRAEPRPQIGLAEEAVRSALHVHHVLRMRADAAPYAKDRLDKERRLHQLAVEKMRRRIQMADVVTLDLEAGVVAAAGFEDMGDVAGRGLEYAFVPAGEAGLLPGVLPGLSGPEPLGLAGNH